MKKIKILIPLAVILFIPWLHKLFYENYLLAFPEIPKDGAHCLAIGSIIILALLSALTRDH